MSEMSPFSLLDLLGSERVGDSRPGLGVGRGAARACGTQANQRNNKVKRERGREREHQRRRALCCSSNEDATPQHIR